MAETIPPPPVRPELVEPKAGEAKGLTSTSNCLP